jgi:hypothetical protein
MFGSPRVFEISLFTLKRSYCAHLPRCWVMYCPESHVLIPFFLARDHRAFANEGLIRMASFWCMAFIGSSPHLLALRAVRSRRRVPQYQLL